jgi:hypothetical protein
MYSFNSQQQSAESAKTDENGIANAKNETRDDTTN